MFRPRCAGMLRVHGSIAISPNAWGPWSMQQIAEVQLQIDAMRAGLRRQDAARRSSGGAAQPANAAG